MSPTKLLNLAATSALLFLDQAAAAMGANEQGTSNSLLRGRGDSPYALDGSVYAMVKIKNTGEQYPYDNWGVWQSGGAYCTNDSGSTGQTCKVVLNPGELQATDLSANSDAATYTYGINGVAINVKVSAEESGILNEDDEVVSSYGGCTGTNTFPSGYTLVSINCDKPAVPDYAAPVYDTGVKYRGINFSGEEWESGSYFTSEDDVNKAKSVGFESSRVPVDMTDIQPAPFAIIDWDSGVAKDYDDSIQLQIDSGLTRVIVDAHNYMIGWGGEQITGAQLANYTGQVAEHYCNTPEVWIGVMNEPHDLTSDPDDIQAEADALFAIYQEVEQKLTDMGITNPRLYEPSDWGGIAGYADPIYQTAFENLRAISNVPDKVYADGHAYGTNPDTPGGSGYGDCDPNGVTHNLLDQVVQWADANGILVTVTEYNGDPSYQNCLDFVKTTDDFMNLHAWNETNTGCVIAADLWGYYLNEGSVDAMDINKYGDPANDPQILAMQADGFLVPGELAGAPTSAPTTPAPSGAPTTSPPSGAPTGSPSARPTISQNPTSTPTFGPTGEEKPASLADKFASFSTSGAGIGTYCAAAFFAVAGCVAYRNREGLKEQMERSSHDDNLLRNQH